MEEINIKHGHVVNDEWLLAMSTHCHRLRRIFFHEVYEFTDQGIAALVSSNHGLEEIGFSECALPTDASLFTIAEHCRKLRWISLDYDGFSDQGFIALVSQNPDLKSLHIDWEFLTEASMLAIA